MTLTNDKPFYETGWFWLIVIGAIGTIVAIIIALIEQTANYWFWILLTLGSSALSIGVYWYIYSDSEKRKAKETQLALIEAVQIGESLQ